MYAGFVERPVRWKGRRTVKALLENPAQLKFLHGEASLPEIVHGHARKRGKQPAIIYYGEPIDYRTLDDHARRLAVALRKLGFRPGDRLGAMLQPCPQCHILYLAALLAGLVTVPIDPMSKLLELEHYFADSGISGLVAMDYLMEAVDKVPGRDRLRHVIVTSFGDYAPATPSMPLHPIMATGRTTANDAIDLRSLIATTEPESVPPVPLDEPAFILYTGGTTGLSKGCVHTHRNLLYTANGQVQFAMSGLCPDDVMLTAWPLTHISGLTAMVAGLLAGATSIILTRWDVDAALAAFSRYQPTVTMWPVPCYWDVLARPGHKALDYARLRVSLVIPFGMEITEKAAHAWRSATGAAMHDWGYGSSEHANYCGYGYGLPFPHPQCTTASHPFPGVEIRIVDFETGRDLGEGDVGEIVTRTPAQLKEYWNGPDKTRETVVDGWVHMNDRGYVKDGVLYFMGKASEVVKVSGYTVSLPEIEAFGIRNEAIQSIAAIGIPHPRKGNQIKAFVTLKPGAQVTAEQLERWFAERVASFKQPVVEIRDSLPVSGAGKLLKRILIAEERSSTTS